MLSRASCLGGASALLLASCGELVSLGRLEEDARVVAPSEAGVDGGPLVPDASTGGTETIYDGTELPALAGHVVDFAGEGEHVYATINFFSGTSAGKVLDLPTQRNGTSALVDTGSAHAGRLSLVAGDRIVFETGAVAATASSRAVLLSRSGGAELGSFSAEHGFAGHPERSEVARVGGTTISAWSPPSTETALMTVNGDTVVDVSSGKTAVVALLDAVFPLYDPSLVRDVPNASDGQRYKVLVQFPLPSSATGGDRSGIVLSNIVVDDADAYVVWKGANDTRLLKIPLGALAVSPNTAVTIASFASGVTAAHLEVDSVDVYVATASAACAVQATGEACLTPLALGRVAKSAAAGTAPTKLQEWTGPSLGVRPYRAFQLSSDHVLWSDGRRLFRRAKAAFSP